MKTKEIVMLTLVPITQAHEGNVVNVLSSQLGTPFQPKIFFKKRQDKKGFEKIFIEITIKLMDNRSYSSVFSEILSGISLKMIVVFLLLLLFILFGVFLWDHQKSPPNPQIMILDSSLCFCC